MPNSTAPLVLSLLADGLHLYGKTLLNPGERLGYLAISPEMPERETIRMPLFITKLFVGLATPNALLMHAIEDIEELLYRSQPDTTATRSPYLRASEIGYQVGASSTRNLLPVAQVANRG